MPPDVFDRTRDRPPWLVCLGSAKPSQPSLMCLGTFATRIGTSYPAMQSGPLFA